MSKVEIDLNLIDIDKSEQEVFGEFFDIVQFAPPTDNTWGEVVNVVELTNGRRLLIDRGGISDFNDLPPEDQGRVLRGEEGSLNDILDNSPHSYLAWEELLPLLDYIRAHFAKMRIN